MKATERPGRCRPPRSRCEAPVARHRHESVDCYCGFGRHLPLKLSADVDEPVVNVRANLPGASPETMNTEVTRILEGACAC